MSEHINPIIVNSAPDHDCASTPIDEDFTLRDLFAAAALAGMRSNTTFDVGFDVAAEYAYKDADAMLAERAKS